MNEMEYFFLVGALVEIDRHTEGLDAEQLENLEFLLREALEKVKEKRKP